MILTNQIRTALEKGLNKRRILEAIGMDGYTFGHKIEHWEPFSDQDAKKINALLSRFERECRMINGSQTIKSQING
jgi:hypothetical protein